MTRLIAAFAAAGTLAASVASAQPQEALNFAGEFQLEQVAGGHVRFVGEVELHALDFRLFADQVELFTDEDRLVASGNVEVVSDSGDCRAVGGVEIELEDGIVRAVSLRQPITRDCTRQ